MRSMTRRSSFLLLAVVLTSGAGSPGAPARAADKPAEPTLDKRATALLEQMSDHLAGLESFRVQVEAADEVVTHQGEKIQFVSRSQVSVRRPDRMRSDRI